MALRLWLGHPQPHRGPSLDSQARAFAQEKVPDAWRAALGLLCSACICHARMSTMWPEGPGYQALGARVSSGTENLWGSRAHCRRRKLAVTL